MVLTLKGQLKATLEKIGVRKVNFRPSKLTVDQSERRLWSCEPMRPQYLDILAMFWWYLFDIWVIFERYFGDSEILRWHLGNVWYVWYISVWYFGGFWVIFRYYLDYILLIIWWLFDKISLKHHPNINLI